MSSSSSLVTARRTRWREPSGAPPSRRPRFRRRSSRPFPNTSRCCSIPPPREGCEPAMSETVVGIDLGGTKVALAELDGRTLGESVLEPTDTSDTERLLDQLVALVERTRSSRLCAVGVGVPSIVEFDTGRVVSSVNIPLRDVRLREVLGERLGVPVFVDNDATVAALAEAHDEELRLVARNLVMLTIGSGVGGGLVLGGRIYRGSTGGAAELGHAIVGLDLSGENAVPDASDFPQTGSLEAVAAGRALDRLVSEAARL